MNNLLDSINLLFSDKEITREEIKKYSDFDLKSLNKWHDTHEYQFRKFVLQRAYRYLKNCGFIEEKYGQDIYFTGKTPQGFPVQFVGVFDYYCSSQNHLIILQAKNHLEYEKTKYFKED